MSHALPWQNVPTMLNDRQYIVHCNFTANIRTPIGHVLNGSIALLEYQTRTKVITGILLRVCNIEIWVALFAGYSFYWSPSPPQRFSSSSFSLVLCILESGDTLFIFHSLPVQSYKLLHSYRGACKSFKSSPQTRTMSHVSLRTISGPCFACILFRESLGTETLFVFSPHCFPSAHDPLFHEARGHGSPSQ